MSKFPKGTSKTQVSKDPLEQIPRIDVIFQRVAIDMVGPLARIDIGNHRLQRDESLPL